MALRATQVDEIPVRTQSLTPGPDSPGPWPRPPAPGADPRRARCTRCLCGSAAHNPNPQPLIPNPNVLRSHAVLSGAVLFQLVVQRL